MQKSFYQKQWFIWLMLIFLTPLGIFLMFKQNLYSKNIRILISLIMGIFFLIMLTTNDNNNVNTIKTSEKPITITSTPKAIEISIPKDLKGYLEFSIKNKLGKDKLIGIEIDLDIITVNLKMDDNFTNGLIETGINSDIKNVFEIVSTRNDYKKVFVREYTKFKDRYGQESNGIACSADITSENLKKVVWNNITISEIPNLSDSYFLHPSLK